MPNYDVNSVLQLGRLKEFGQAVTRELTAMKTVSASAIKSAEIVDMKLKLWTNTTKTGDPAIVLDLPSELYLDQISTKFEANFVFNAETYPGATNPSLDGKPVLVIAVKDTNAAGTVTTTYSFLNMETLVDVYTIAQGSANILAIDSGTNQISFKVSAAAGNHFTINPDGAMVDVSDKIDKVANATARNLAIMKADGGIDDSGHTFATTEDIAALNAELFPSA